MKQGQQMKPRDFIRFIREQLKKERSIVLPKKIIKDTIRALIEWEGLNRDDLIVHDYADKVENHVTLTLKQYVK